MKDVPSSITSSSEIPAPDADKAIGGTVTASSTNSPDGVEMQKAFDGLTDSKWLIFAKTGWIQYQFGGLLAHKVSSYTITSANDESARDPKDWTLKGSNDGTNWIVLDARTGQTFAKRFQKNTYVFSNSTAYRYYRLDVSANSGANELQIAEIELIK